MSTKTQENQDFQIKPLSYDNWCLLLALADNKNVKITVWNDNNYKYYFFKTLDNKHVLAKFKKEAYHPLKHVYKYSIVLGNGTLIAQGYTNGELEFKLDPNIDYRANILWNKIIDIVAHEYAAQSLVKYQKPENKEIMEYISKFINIRVR